MAEMRRPLISLTASEVLAFNREIVRRAGQRPSAGLLRERGLLESAVLRSQHAAYYEGAEVTTRAALYMVGIALNHPFTDGNKRTGYFSGMTVLQVNGIIAMAAGLDDVRLGVWLEAVVARTLTLEAFVERLRERLAKP